MGSLFALGGRTALVTGASAGLGCHSATTLAAHGARVIAAAGRADQVQALLLLASDADAFMTGSAVDDGGHAVSSL